MKLGALRRESGLLAFVGLRSRLERGTKRLPHLKAFDATNSEPLSRVVRPYSFPDRPLLLSLATDLPRARCKAR